MLNAELRCRVRTEWAKAEVLSGGLDPDRAVMLACDLLVAGIEDEAVVALAAESARTLSVHDAERRFTDMAEALGVVRPSTAEAVVLVLADTCHRILDGSLPIREGTHRLLVTGHDGSPLSDRVPAVLDLLDRLEEDLSGGADVTVRTAIEALARDLLTILGPGGGVPDGEPARQPPAPREA